MIQSSRQISNKIDFKDAAVNKITEDGFELTESVVDSVVLRASAEASPLSNRSSLDSSSNASNGKPQPNIVNALSNAANATTKSFNNLINKMNEKGKKHKKSDSVGSVRALVESVEKQPPQQQALKSSSSSQILSSVELKQEEFETIEMPVPAPAVIEEPSIFYPNILLIELLTV
jgi:hypothetical protein